MNHETHESMKPILKNKNSSWVDGLASDYWMQGKTSSLSIAKAE